MFSHYFKIFVSLSILFSSTTTLSEKKFVRQESADQKYAVVVDCGSSGSRAHIYKWPENASSGEISNEIVSARDESTGKKLVIRVKPGLASLKDEPEKIANYMRPLMNYVEAHIPDEAKAETPIFIFGTAGLRLLAAEAQNELMKTLRDTLVKNYNFPNIITQVISGFREGQYQWLNINSMRNRLGSEFDLLNKSLFCLAPKTRRFGILEMGGASAQVAFEIHPLLDKIIRFKLNREALTAYESSIQTINLAKNRTTKLFSTTFMGFGTNSARDITIDLLVREALKIFPISKSSSFNVNKTTLTVQDPCLPRGAQQTVLKSRDLILDPDKNLGFQSKANESEISINLVGFGNFGRCKQLLDRVVWLVKDEHLNCNDVACSTPLLGTKFVPFKYFQFLGLSELYYTTNEIIQASGLFNPALIVKRTNKICSSSYEKLLLKYSAANEADSERVLLECFKASWILTWLQYGLRMPMNSIPDLHTVENDNNWTFGALIDILSE